MKLAMRICCCNLCWKGHNCAQSFVLSFSLQLNILTGTFLLISCSNTFQTVLWFVHGQGQNITKEFVRFHDNSLTMTDRHPNPLFSVCIISPNAQRKIMQTKYVRKTGTVFFGGREIIRGSFTRAKSARSIIKTKTSCIIKNNAACFSFNNAACFTFIYPLVKHFPPYFLLTRNNQKYHNKYF